MDWERLVALKQKLDFIPQKPGVYIHKNAKQEILYVGKAKNLRARLKSYFTSFDQHSSKTKALVEKIWDYDVIVAATEIESLLLENNLIKHHKPPYNILLRDDKTYPYLKIDTSEAWPRVVLTRRRKKDDGLYFGPYPMRGQIHQILQVIDRFFPLIKCTPTVFKTVSRPCNYYDIKRCLGPCKLPVDKKEYEAHLQHVIAILKGQSSVLAKQMKADMQRYAAALNFEKAAMLRDQYQALLNLSALDDSVSFDIPLSCDVIGFFWSEDLVVFYVSSVRDGKLVGGQDFVVKNTVYAPLEGAKKEHVIFSFICQYYGLKDVPDEVFLFSGEEQLFETEKILQLNAYLNIKKHEFNQQPAPTTDALIFFASEKIYLQRLQTKYSLSKLSSYKKTLRHLVDLALQNAQNKFHEQLKVDEKAAGFMADVKQVIGLKTLPRLLECMDISTFQGAQTVASQVIFRDGVPWKSGYRKYIVKENVGHTDDFGSLREVVRRRFKHRETLPDLLVIDGGTPQVREVSWVLLALGLGTLPVVGLAKSRVKNAFYDVELATIQERIVIPNRTPEGMLDPKGPCQTVILQEGSPAFQLLTQLRDEAHRFAIQFHRSRRDKASMQSVRSDKKKNKKPQPDSD